MVVDDVNQSINILQSNLFKEFNLPSSQGSRNAKK